MTNQFLSQLQHFHYTNDGTTLATAVSSQKPETDYNCTGHHHTSENSYIYITFNCPWLNTVTPQWNALELCAEAALGHN
jgi:hypothetical protein